MGPLPRRTPAGKRKNAKERERYANDPAARERKGEYSRKRREDPEYREHEREYSRARREDPEYREHAREYKREYNKMRREDPEYREHEREYSRKRYENDSAFRAQACLRSRLQEVFKQQGLVKLRPSKKYGIDWQAVLDHLGPQPSPDHEVDHIRPVASFDHSDPDQIRECWAPENHRWLHRDLNRAKSAMTEDEFLARIKDDPYLHALWDADLGVLY